MTFTIDHINQLSEIAKTILDSNKSKRIFAINGEMGAGKTTLIKELCACLKSTNVVSSPTFTLINEYEDGLGNPIYHFDLYRLKNIEEAIQIGCEDYFYSDNYCFIEWATLILSILPEETITINITVEETTKKRYIEF